MAIINSLSAGIARIETVVGASLGALTMMLILLNVVTRSFAKALFWVDEAAIASMVWMAFLGASVAIHHRDTVAVSLVPDALAGKAAKLLFIAVDLTVLVFCLVLFVLCWKWFDPLTLALHGFDTRAFSGATFNFIYSEVSTTLDIRKFWLWLIVPMFAAFASIHALSNLLNSITGKVRPGGQPHHSEV
jgi:TRAP-type C4-dicarboxylate transport system permease small subunit